jgi:3-hydroxyisobutyrate dehydrogenase
MLHINTSRRKAVHKVCWLGLGRMGLPMAAHLSAVGFDVHGYDPSVSVREAATRAGITMHSTAQEAGDGAHAVFTMLPTYAHVEQALSAPGFLRATADAALIIDSSTISGANARELSVLAATAGRRFLDAPVSGGTPGAHAGTLTFMVGGPEESVQEAAPYFSAMGSRTFHIGEVGCGQSAKTVNNMLLAMNMAAVCEAAALAGKLGLDHHALVDIVKVSSGDSWVLRNFYPVAGVVENAPANRDFAPGFTAHLMRKDVGLALEAAAPHTVDLSMTEEAARRLDRLINAGSGDLDFSALMQVAQGRNLETVKGGVV